MVLIVCCEAEDGIRGLVRSRGLGDVYKRQAQDHLTVSQLLTGDTGKRMRAPIVVSTTLILFMALLVGMAAYLPLLGQLVAPLLPVGAVSYTHLPLPTSDLVSISVVAVSL